MRILSLGFDLGWASETGFAFIAGGRGMPLTVVDYGEIKSPSYSGKVNVSVQMERAWNLASKVRDRLVVMNGFVEQSDLILLSYEDMSWVLAAARSGKSRRPVTKSSLYSMIGSITALWVGVKSWLESVNSDCEIRVSSMNIRHARSALGVDDWAWYGQNLDLDSKLKELNYANEKKRKVGVAVTLRLSVEEGIDLIPESDHIADAFCLALVAMDEAKMEV